MLGIKLQNSGLAYPVKHLRRKINAQYLKKKKISESLDAIFFFLFLHLAKYRNRIIYFREVQSKYLDIVTVIL